LLIAAITSYSSYLYDGNNKAKTWGIRLLGLSLTAQAASIGMLVYQIKTLQNIVGHINTAQYPKFAIWMLQQQDVPQQQINQMGSAELYNIASNWVSQNAAQLHLSLNANPVELSALITAFAGTFFVVLFNIDADRLREGLPAADTLDGLMYKLGGVAFAGLALLLM